MMEVLPSETEKATAVYIGLIRALISDDIKYFFRDEDRVIINEFDDLPADMQEPWMKLTTVSSFYKAHGDKKAAYHFEFIAGPVDDPHQKFSIAVLQRTGPNPATTYIACELEWTINTSNEYSTGEAFSSFLEAYILNTSIPNKPVTPERPKLVAVK